MVSQPSAPNPYTTAAAQGSMNRETAIAQQGLNSTNQYTPDGSLTYNQVGSWSDGTPHWSVTQTLSPANRDLYDTNQNTQLNLAAIGNQQVGQIGGLLRTPFDMSQGAIDGQTAGMPGLPQYRQGATAGAQPQSWGASSGWGDLVGSNINAMNDVAGYAGAAVPNANDFQARYTGAPGQVQSQNTSAPDQLAQARYTQAPDQIASQRTYAPAPTSARYTQAPGEVGTQLTQAPGQIDAGSFDDPSPSRVQPWYDSAPSQQVAVRHIGNNDQLQDQLYGAAFQRYQPQLDRQRQNMEADLANRGLRPGSTGYDNAVTDNNNAVNDLRSQTFLNGQNQAFQQSAARAQNDFGQELQGQNQFYNLQHQANQANFAQDLSSNNQFFNQSDTANQHAFQNRMSSQGQDFQQNLAANSQNFGQNLSASGQAFQQAMGANAQNFGQDFQSSQAGFQNALAANGQNFGQDFQSSQAGFQNSLAANNQNFGQDFQNNQTGFQDRLSANGQNFTQDLQGQGQAFQQQLGANQANFGQDATRSNQLYAQGLQSAQFQNQSVNDRFSRLSGAASANLGAQNQDFTQGMQGQQNGFNQSMALAQFGSAQDQYSYQVQMAQRQQALNELLQNRTEPMNEIASLMGGSQVSRPTWTATPTSSIQPANLEGLVQSNYAQQTSQYNAALGGLAGLGGTAARGLFGLSDERAKLDIRQIARLPNGLGVYAYRFADGRAEIGLLAQEVVMLDPSAIMHRDDGLMAVDYARALEAA
ncbi:hypothetical protein [uncultured Methylobacterium sp.]|uniref:hypothetical protein n=1 Tax=uncultured Methylobacterium sp. TaxID=157278 RepID=UPI0035C9566E